MARLAHNTIIYCIDNNTGLVNFKKGGIFNYHGNFNVKKLFVRHFTAGVAS
jgi:hypothetical protein